MHITLTAANILSYLSYFGVDIALLLVAGWIYVQVTPLNELVLIESGNAAGAVMLAGPMLGFAFVLYSCNTHSAGLADSALWSVAALLCQIVAFEILRVIMYLVHDDWKTKISNGDMAHGIFFGSFSLAIGILNAACVT